MLRPFFAFVHFSLMEKVNAKLIRCFQLQFLLSRESLYFFPANIGVSLKFFFHSCITEIFLIFQFNGHSAQNNLNVKFFLRFSLLRNIRNENLNQFEYLWTMFLKCITQQRITKVTWTYFSVSWKFAHKKKDRKKVLRRNMEEDKNQVIYFHSVFDVGQIFCI